MDNDRKCNIELCEELELMRSHVFSLERERDLRMKRETTDDLLQSQLRERVKELSCLYGLSRLIDLNENSLEKIMQGTAQMLPVAWQYPEIACARVLFKEQIHLSCNFKQTHWKQESTITISGQKMGAVEVFYLKRMPILDEGPFLKEERLLINAVSDRLAKVVERIEAKRQVQVERQALHDANSALHAALVHSQRERRILGISIQENIDKITKPILYTLQDEMNSRQLKYLDLLEKNLGDIVSPFVEQNQGILHKLSPVEIMICNMIKHGLSTKKIASLREISPATVNRHRENIRHKLGLTNRKVNLVSYLNNIPEE